MAGFFLIKGRNNGLCSKTVIFLVICQFLSLVVLKGVVTLDVSGTSQNSNAASQEDRNPSGLYVTSAIHWPTCKVGPYDWMYYPVEVPEATVLLSITLKKIQWQDQSDQVGPLLCIRKGGPPLPFQDDDSLQTTIGAAANEAAKLRPNKNAFGACAWFDEDTSFNVTSNEDLPGIWELGFFSVTNDSRTQSQMIPRGPVYHFEIHAATYGCTGGGFVLGNRCQNRVTPLPPSFPPLSPTPPHPPPPTLSPPFPSDAPTPTILPPRSDPPFPVNAPSPPPPAVSPAPGPFLDASNAHQALSNLRPGLELSWALLGKESTRFDKMQSSVDQTVAAKLASVSSDYTEDVKWQYLKGQCFNAGEKFKYYQLKIQGLAADIDVEVYKEHPENNKLESDDLFIDKNLAPVSELPVMQNKELSAGSSSREEAGFGSTGNKEYHTGWKAPGKLGRFSRQDTQAGVSYLGRQSTNTVEYNVPTDVNPPDEDKGRLFLRHGSIPIETEEHLLPPIEVPEQGMWYIAVPAVQKLSRSSNMSQNLEDGVQGVEKQWSHCFTLRWRLRMCSSGQGGFDCGWPVLNLERVLPERQFESVLDAVYLPARTSRPSNDDWFSLTLMPPLVARAGSKPSRNPFSLLSMEDEKMHLGPAEAGEAEGELVLAEKNGGQISAGNSYRRREKVRQEDTMVRHQRVMVENQEDFGTARKLVGGYNVHESGRESEREETEGPSPLLHEQNNEEGYYAEDDEFWGYFSLVIPPGATGSILSVTVKIGSHTNTLGGHSLLSDQNPSSEQGNRSETERVSTSAEGQGRDDYGKLDAKVKSMYFEIMGKLGGVPTDGDADIKTGPSIISSPFTRPSGSEGSTATGKPVMSGESLSSENAFAESVSLGSGLLKMGKEGSVTADVFYPSSGTWYFGVRYYIVEGLAADISEQMDIHGNGTNFPSGFVPESNVDKDITGESSSQKPVLERGTSSVGVLEGSSSQSSSTLGGSIHNSIRGLKMGASTSKSSGTGFGLAPPKPSDGIHLKLGSARSAKVNVVMHGCSNGCNGHGGCHMLLDGSRLHSVGYCYCDRSHGGANCSLELLSPNEESKHVFFLVASNLAAILPSMWTIRHKAYPEWVIYTTSGVSSALYHSCDTDSWCAADYWTLQFADFFLSFMAVVITFLFIAAPEPGPKLTAVICFTIVDAVIARDRATSGSNIYIVAFLGFLGLSMAWALEFVRERRLWQQRSREEVFRPESWQEYWTDRRRWHNWFFLVIAFVRQLVARYRWLYLLAGFVALGASKLNWWYETASTYWIWHSLWHLSIYTSAYFFLCATEPPRIHTEVRPSSPDSSSGIEGVRLGTAPLDRSDDDEEKTLLYTSGEGSSSRSNKAK